MFENMSKSEINEFIDYDSIFIKEKKDYSKTNMIIIIIAICLGCLLLIIISHLKLYRYLLLF